MDPTMLPMPPRMMTRRTMKPAEPMVMSTPRMGAMRPPAKPTRPRPTPMVTMNTFSEFTPSSAATSGLKATVLMPRPMRVRLRKKCKASRMATLMRITATRSTPDDHPPDLPVSLEDRRDAPRAGAEHEQDELGQEGHQHDGRDEHPEHGLLARPDAAHHQQVEDRSLRWPFRWSRWPPRRRTAGSAAPPATRWCTPQERRTCRR